MSQTQANEDDFWSSEDFEDNVARGIIATFETSVIGNLGSHPKDRLKIDDIKKMRRHGLYIPSDSRVVLGDEDDMVIFDTKNDRPPIAGAVASVREERGDVDGYKGYLDIQFIEAIDRLPKGVTREAGGQLYRLHRMHPTNEGGISGETNYFSLKKDGGISLCGRTYSGFLKGKGGVFKQYEVESEEVVRSVKGAAASALAFLADERFCWRIEAIGGDGSAVRLGCMREEVKSLLYARDLPVTETGRKRPILHLVAAHKRRMKSGTDIDIDMFLRGTMEVEMNGTLFRVHAPGAMLDKMRNKKK